ncbi:DUF6056 family protein [Aeromonas veronii]
MNEKIIRYHACFLYVLAFAVIFLLLFSVQIVTPMQSDDYSYLAMGGNIDRYFHHYISWSGRISADVTSSSLLYFFSKKWYSALNSLALTSLIFMISYLPTHISNRRLALSNVFAFVVLFLIYWIANTNLGQTTFWIVGSANYLWTNLYIIAYIYLLVFFARRFFVSLVVSYFSLLCVFCVGAIAGCSNENTGVFAFLFTVFAWFLYRRNNSELRSSVFFVGSIGVLFGWIILVCSPGNVIRANYFSAWYSQSLSWRIDEHVYSRFPSMMEQYWLVFLVAILAMLTIFISEKEENETGSFFAKFSMFFFLSAILAALLMVGAPAIPSRTGNGSLVFFLIMLSFIFSIQSCYNENAAKNVFTFFILSLSIYFVPSYKLVYSAYNETAYQEEVRNDIIESSKRNGKVNISIPDFNFSRLIRSVDAFDLYHNPDAMGKYWGVNTVNVFSIPFNYGAIAKDNNNLDVNKEIGYGMVLHKIYLYKTPSKPFYRNQTRLIFELNKNPQDLPKDIKIYVHLKGVGINSKADDFVSKYKFINADIGQSKGYMIGEKYYVEQGISQNINIEDIDVVDAGTFK